MPESSRFFPGATRAVVPKPTGEANGCKLRHGPPKNAPESAICGVLRKRSTTTDSVLWLAPISSPRKRASHGRWTNLRYDPSDAVILHSSFRVPHLASAPDSRTRRRGRWCGCIRHTRQGGWRQISVNSENRRLHDACTRSVKYKRARQKANFYKNQYQYQSPMPSCRKVRARL